MICQIWISARLCKDPPPPLIGLMRKRYVLYLTKFPRPPCKGLRSVDEGATIILVTTYES